MNNVKLKLCGDRAVLVEFGQEIHPAIHARVRAFCAALERADLPGISEIVPAYGAVTVHYRPEEIRWDELQRRLRQVLNNAAAAEIPPATVWEIPVLYGGEEGPDLDFVARHSGRAPEEVIRRHSAPEYLVYMLGFTPGFPYLGGMDAAIAAPRLTAPRVKIPAGSVGIAGQQTGVYPIASPGGWQLIGRTPVKLYDPHRERPVLLEAGDYVKFCAVDAAEFRRIRELEAAGQWTCRTWRKEG